MDRVEKLFVALIIALVIALVTAFIFFGCTPWGRGMYNSWFHAVQKVDDATRYETRKKVEDSCRAMVSSYEADKLTWEQYKDSGKDEEVSWANQAKMRANRTASNYNNYILKNSYVWDGNIPLDIIAELPVIE